jgi:Rhodopirellula transposase DDE domain
MGSGRDLHCPKFPLIFWRGDERLRSILLLCDSGGSNSSRQYLFKQDLQALASELGIEIRIAHYPPYTSKYNPIEHRLFPHLTRVCQGVIFDSVEMVKDLMAKAKTHTGLRVLTTVLERVYKTGRQVTENFKQTMEIVFDDYLPQWNYTAKPQRA